MNAPQQAVLFVVRNDEVSYGGGLNAVENKTTWHGSMTPRQRELFDTLISNSNWWVYKADGYIGEGVGRFSIRIREGVKENKFVLPLTDPTATSVYELLLKIAKSRFDTTINALPKPSVDEMLQNRGLGENE
ncbi:MAG: hypothetical protein QF444_05055 [Phycisphaerales bacterium]|nr:hypothetical protein [Phycisphaerales bacterium]